MGQGFCMGKLGQGKKRVFGNLGLILIEGEREK